MINDMKPGEVRRLADGTPIKFIVIPNLSSLDYPCYGCAFENEPCGERRVLLGDCDAMNREDKRWGMFIKLPKDE